MSVQLRVVENVSAPVGSVWNLISDFGAIQLWHPDVIRCEASGAGVGAERTVFFKEWWAQERLRGLDPSDHHLEYEVTDSSRPEVIGARTRMSLSPLGPGSTQLEWTSELPSKGTDVASLKASLEAYYRKRVGHLRAALGLG